MLRFILSLYHGGLGLTDNLCGRKQYAQYVVSRLLAAHRFKKTDKILLLFDDKRALRRFFYTLGKIRPVFNIINQFINN